MLYKEMLDKAPKFSAYIKGDNDKGIFIPLEEIPILKAKFEKIEKQENQLEIQRQTINKIMVALKQRGIML